MATSLAAILSLLTGYLLGSLSPSYVLGRLLRGIDIRTVGFRNAGVRNVRSEIGMCPAALTAVIDVGKGAAAAGLALYVYGLPEYLAFLPTAAAVAGHIFPVTLGFRGGRGHATSVGLYLFFVIRETAAGTYHPLTIGMILLVAGIIFIAARNGEATGIVTFGFMTVITPLELGLTPVSATATALALFPVVTLTRQAVRRGVFHMPEEVEIKPWRIIARPFALLFIPIDIYRGRTVVLIILGALSVIFSAADLFRFGFRLKLTRLYKDKEERSFSSMTKFLVSIFLTFLVFGGEIPYLGLTFTTVGDLFAKVIGVRFGRLKLFESRSIAGTLGFLGGSLAATYILYRVVAVPLLFVFVGSVFATLVELFSESFDDNFTVGLVSSGLLAAMRQFLPV